MQLISSIQPGVTQFSTDFVIKIQEFKNIRLSVKYVDVIDSVYYLMSVFVNDWLLLLNTLVFYAMTIVFGTRNNPIFFGIFLSGVATVFLLLVVTKTAIGKYYVNHDNSNLVSENNELKESPKIKKNVLHYTDAMPSFGSGEKVHKRDRVITVLGNSHTKDSPITPSNSTLVHTSSGSTNHDDVSTEYNSDDNNLPTRVPKIPVVPFAIDIPGHRTVPIEIQTGYSMSTGTPHKSQHSAIDNDHKDFTSPTKVSPKNKAALEVDTSRLLSSNDRGMSHGEIERGMRGDFHVFKSQVLKTVESRLTPNKAPSGTSALSTPRAIYVRDATMSSNPQTLVIPTPVTPPRETKTKASTGTQTDKSTLRDGRTSRTVNIGDDNHRSSRKIVNVTSELPSTLNKRGAVMAPPKGTPPRVKSSISSGISEGSKVKTPTKSSISSSGGEARDSHSRIGSTPFTSLLTDTYDSVINMNVTPSTNSKSIGERWP